MMKFAALSIASISALAASTAFAQVQEAAPAAPAGAAPAASAPVQSAPAQSGTVADPSAAAPAAGATTAQAAPAANTNAQVAAVVDAGFPKYDANKDGKLSEAEFKQWISDLKTQEMAAQGKPADPAAVSQYASAAMAAADKDKDGVVTKQDMTTFLGG